MRSALLALVAVFALVATIQADDEPQPVASDRYQALIAEFTSAQRMASKAFSAATSLQARTEILGEFDLTTGKFASRFLELAEKHADEPIAFDALVWAVENDRQGDVGKQAAKAITSKHLDHPKIVRVCERLGRSIVPAAETFLQAVLDRSDRDETQAYAAYGLALVMLRRSEERNATAEALLARVAQDYEKVANGALAKSAARELFVIQHLSIGCEAPEIKGEDIDGVLFHLAEYRGKVVVLDFWGNW